MVRSDSPPSFLRPMTTRRDVALGAQLGQGLEQVLEALHGDVGRRGGDEAAGDALDVGQRPEDVLVDADGHDVQLLRVDGVVGGDVVVAEFFDTVMTRVRRLATRVCILVKAYQRAFEKRSQLGAGVLHLEAAVDGDRVVDGGQHRQAHPLHGQQAVAEALVVLHEVEVVDPAARRYWAARTREGERLGEGAERERRDLDPVAERS